MLQAYETAEGFAKGFRAKLGRDPRQERRSSSFRYRSLVGKNENWKLDRPARAKADIDQLIENDRHREGRTSFKQNHPSTPSACVPSSKQ